MNVKLPVHSGCINMWEYQFLVPVTGTSVPVSAHYGAIEINELYCVYSGVLIVSNIALKTLSFPSLFCVLWFVSCYCGLRMVAKICSLFLHMWFCKADLHCIFSIVYILFCFFRKEKHDFSAHIFLPQSFKILYTYALEKLLCTHSLVSCCLFNIENPPLNRVQVSRFKFLRQWKN